MTSPKTLSATSQMLLNMQHPLVIHAILVLDNSSASAPMVEESMNNSSNTSLINKVKNWFMQRIVQKHIEYRSLPVRSNKYLGIIPSFSWEPVTDFNPDAHFIVTQAKCTTDKMEQECELRRVMSEQLQRPLDESRPLWEVVIVENWTPSNAQVPVIIRLHHCIGDGFALIEMLLSATDESRQIQDNWPTLLAVPARLVEEQIMSKTRTILSIVARCLSAIWYFFTVIACFISYIVRLVIPLKHLQPFYLEYKFRKETDAYDFAATPHIDLKDFAAIRRHFGGTVNSIVLYCLSQAISRYLESRHDNRADKVPFAVSMNLRLPRITPREKEWVATLDNITSAAIVDIPLHREPNCHQDVVDCLELIKKGAGSSVNRISLFLLSLLPVCLARRAFALLFSTIAGEFTSVCGPNKRLTMSGMQIVDMMVSLANPVSFFTAFSYDGKMRITMSSVRPHVRTAEVMELFHQEFINLVHQSHQYSNVKSL